MAKIRSSISIHLDRDTPIEGRMLPGSTAASVVLGALAGDDVRVTIFGADTESLDRLAGAVAHARAELVAWRAA